MQSSKHFNGKIFLNPVPTDVMKPGSFLRLTKKLLQKHPAREPVRPLGPFPVDNNALNTLPPDALRTTWLGHSTVLIETGGRRFLTDPIWYSRASPFGAVGPKRFFQNPLPLASLPPLDAVLLSHDHYDHLDKQTILYLCNKGIPVITMLGVGKRLRDWGVPSNLVTELDWWQHTNVGNDTTITATPARHFSGRWLGDRFKTLWGAFAIKSSTHNVFFGADSGYYNGFGQIAKQLGPFDLIMLEIGAYNEDWENIHMGPISAVQATVDMGRPLLLPIHWGTFNLAFHPWKEPVELLIQEAAERGVDLLLPTPGETRIVDGKPYKSNWWQPYT